VWYNGQVEITHVKEASSRQSSKSRIDFYEAMWIFYDKHYRSETNWLMDKAILLGIVVKGGIDVARHLWEFTRQRSRRGDGGEPQPANVSVNVSTNVSVADVSVAKHVAHSSSYSPQ